MRPTVGFVAALLVMLSLATACFSIGPKPQDHRQTGVETYRFRPMSDMIDVPQMPAPVRTTDTCRALVLLVDFEDKLAQVDTSAFSSMLFGESQGSMKAYFEENSYGKFSLTGDTYGWFRSACKHGDIVNRDHVWGTADDHGLDTSPDAINESICSFPLNIWGLVAHTVNLAADSIEFARYDNDGPDGVPSSGDDDGFVDALLIVHSGVGAEIFGGLAIGANHIWSLHSSLDYYGPTAGTSVQGIRIGPFILVPELGQIGVYAHEFCHLLGLPDLYNSETGLSIVGDLCLMDQGAWNGPHKDGSVPCHLSAPMKYVLGWIEPEEICFGCDVGESVDGAQIQPHGTTSHPYQVLGNPGDMDWTPEGTGTGEYFLLENRQQAFGYFESYLPYSGLLIWKVDESQPDNNRPQRRLAEVIQADGEVVDPDIGDPGDPRRNVPGEPSDFWPGELGKHDFTPRTDPSSDLSSGRFSGVGVENITEVAGASITADIRVGLPKKGVTYAYPNPYKLGQASPMRIVFVPEPGPDAPHPGSFEVQIFDFEGNFVRRLDATGEVGTDGTALWDGTDEGGNRVDTGLYFYYVTSSGQEATGVLGIRK